MLRSLSVAALLALAGAVSQSAAAAAPYLGAPASGGVRRGGRLSVSCAACHGAHGNSISADFPNLAGQNYNYLLKELEQFRSGVRRATPMTAMVATVAKAPGDRNLKELAAYFAAQKLDRTSGANASEPKPSRALAAAGYRTYVEGDSAAGVPACAACHMPGGTGNGPMAIPALAGQHAKYIATELRRFASGRRHNSPGQVMETIAKRLTDEQITAVAAYVEALRPALVAGVGSRGYAAYVEAAAAQPVPGIPASGLSAADSPSGGDPSRR